MYDPTSMGSCRAPHLSTFLFFLARHGYLKRKMNDSKWHGEEHLQTRAKSSDGGSCSLMSYTLYDVSILRHCFREYMPRNELDASIRSTKHACSLSGFCYMTYHMGLVISDIRSDALSRSFSFFYVPLIATQFQTRRASCIRPFL